MTDWLRNECYATLDRGPIVTMVLLESRADVGREDLDSRAYSEHGTCVQVSPFFSFISTTGGWVHRITRFWEDPGSDVVLLIMLRRLCSVMPELSG